MGKRGKKYHRRQEYHKILVEEEKRDLEVKKIKSENRAKKRQLQEITPSEGGVPDVSMRPAKRRRKNPGPGKTNDQEDMKIAEDNDNDDEELPRKRKTSRPKGSLIKQKPVNVNPTKKRVVKL
eukprot:c7913_g1_i2.p1 GENE.c7913_g1_i2~~c7913_g1_i2.p1  ORF type:complete len:133 (+),score=27.69 c7913_g1_i2:32-400(+)